MQGEKCSTCSGSGWVPEGNCPVCGGLGKIPRSRGRYQGFIISAAVFCLAIIIAYIIGLQEAGFALAAGGGIIAIAGALVNNFLCRHRLAMKFWGISNPSTVLWAGGFLAGLWTADLGMYFVLASSSVFMMSNWYGLWRFRGRGLP